MAADVATTETSSTQCVHLLVLIHGMWGNPGHLAEMRRIMEETRGREESERGPRGERLHLLLAETNRDDGTYDGIDWGGERVAEEIYEEVKELEKDGKKKVARFSVTGYSLGGLIARYVVGILHQRGFFESVTPVNFNTVATPHVGLPKYSTFLSSVFAFFGPKLLSRTGEQFYVVDKWSENGRPILEVMADPNRIFYQTLTLFEQVRIYANAVNDMTVPYVTAGISEEDIFANHTLNGIQIELDDQYPPLIKTYTLPTVLTPREKPRVLSAKWFKSLKPERPLLPPALQFGFPFNVLLILITPVLVPLVLSLIITRLALASRASRARIKLLEKEESNTERLAHIIGKLEREVEDAVVDIFDSPGLPEAESSQPSLPAEANGKPLSGAKVDLDAALGVDAKEKQEILLSETQHKIISWLNTLPGLKKELVFIHPVRNSHSVIISRDVKRFPSHKEGEGVLRHWADHFII